MKRADIMKLSSLIHKLIKKQFDFGFFKTEILNKITVRKNKNHQPLTLGDLRTYTMASVINRDLEKYRNIYAGKNILIVGGGPTLKYLEIPENCVKIGINRAYKLENIEFDYLYAQDEMPSAKEMDDFINYRPETCTKMVGILTEPNYFKIRPGTINRMKNKLRLVLNNRNVSDSLCSVDIASEPLMRFRGSVFAVLQFAYLTSCEKVYLAGFDCSDSGHMFTNKKEEFKLSYQKESWERMKIYRDLHFPETEIISLNPVGLKGLFKDVYTQSYVDAHPELLSGNIEIIKG